MASWNTIPAELRLAILDIVFLACTNDDVLWNSRRLGSYRNPKPGRRQRKSSRIKSQLSTVCREWQQYFEKWNFHDLVLTQSDLWSFLSMMKQTPMYRLAYVKRIHFKVLLEEYDCNSCMTKEEEFTIQRSVVLHPLIDTTLTVPETVRSSPMQFGTYFQLFSRAPDQLQQRTRQKYSSRSVFSLQATAITASGIGVWRTSTHFSTPIAGGPGDETTEPRTTLWTSPFKSASEKGGSLT
jgi:hypothetical protein